MSTGGAEPRSDVARSRPAEGLLIAGCERDFSRSCPGGRSPNREAVARPNLQRLLRELASFDRALVLDVHGRIASAIGPCVGIDPAEHALRITLSAIRQRMIGALLAQLAELEAELEE